MKSSPPVNGVELRAKALRLLARREHSRAELARKLAPHAESPQALDALLEQLVAKKQLSDERYAEQRAHSLSRKYGAARIRHELRAKGLTDELCRRACSGLNEEQKAQEILTRKYRTAATTHEERARRARFLQSRGFSGEIIRQALKLSSSEVG